MTLKMTTATRHTIPHDRMQEATQQKYLNRKMQYLEEAAIEILKNAHSRKSRVAASIGGISDVSMFKNTKNITSTNWKCLCKE